MKNRHIHTQITPLLLCCLSISTYIASMSYVLCIVYMATWLCRCVVTQIPFFDSLVLYRLCGCSCSVCRCVCQRHSENILKHNDNVTKKAALPHTPYILTYTVTWRWHGNKNIITVEVEGHPPGTPSPRWKSGCWCWW